MHWLHAASLMKMGVLSKQCLAIQERVKWLTSTCMRPRASQSGITRVNHKVMRTRALFVGSDVLVL